MYRNTSRFDKRFALRDLVLGTPYTKIDDLRVDEQRPECKAVHERVRSIILGIAPFSISYETADQIMRALQSEPFDMPEGTSASEYSAKYAQHLRICIESVLRRHNL